jgi:flagellar protein FliO/FliZ
VSFGAAISSILAIILALAFVLAMAWGTIFLMKKWQDRQLDTQDGESADWTIRFIRALPLGQRERVALIEVRGETLLIGITGGSMTLLNKWAGDAPVSEIEKAYQAAQAGESYLPPKPGKNK